MFIVRKIYIDMTSQDIEFKNKNAAEGFIKSTLEIEQAFHDNNLAYLTIDHRVRAFMLLEKTDKDMKLLERYDLDIRFKRTL